MVDYIALGLAYLAANGFEVQSTLPDMQSTLPALLRSMADQIEQVPAK